MKRISTLVSLLLTLGCSSLPNPETASAEDAKTIILERAEDYQTLHFGEEHNKTQADNQFIISLLPDLRRKGFSYFAMELDTHEQPLVDQYLNGRISFEEFCTRDPYGIRFVLPTLIAAHDTGYKVVLFDERYCGTTAPGDPTCSNIEDRDINQFDNLKKLIFDHDPKAKVVVFSGRHHIDEIPRLHFPFENPMIMLPNHKGLGYYLNQFTAGRNLSISLVEDQYEKNHPAGYVAPDLGFNIE